MPSYLALAPAPVEEDCAQVGTADYTIQARAECRRFITLLRTKFGPEPVGARLAIKTFAHDFGDYVVGREKPRLSLCLSPQVKPGVRISRTGLPRTHS